jgi:L-fucose dehydrogenase
MDLGLTDKVVIVTGGARGIAEGIVRVLSAEGAIVAIVGGIESDNIRLQNELKNAGATAYSVQAELGTPAACKTAVDSILQKFGRIEGLVNNTGENVWVGLESGNYEKFVESLQNDLLRYYLMAQFSLPFLKKSGGSIINISYKTAETGHGNGPAYTAVNGGRNAMTREWAVELLKYGIRVNAVIVSECRTPQYGSWVATLEKPDEKLNETTTKIPYENRKTSAVEIAQMVAFLLSDKSSHTTGQLIHANAGFD